MWFPLRKLQRKVRAKKRLMPPEVDTSRALFATTFREFDDAATVPLYKFEGVEDYYRRSSSAQYVTRVRIPKAG